MPVMRPRYRSTDATTPRFSLADRLAILTMFLLPVPSFLGDLAARTADAVRFGAVSGRLLLTPRLKWGRHVRRTSTILVAFFCSASLSMMFGISHSLRDVLDVLRVAAFWLVFIFGASLARRSPSDLRSTAVSCLKLLLAIGVLNALFTICQYRFPNVTRPFQELFAMGERHIDLLSEQGRAFGFFVNPNTNAVMLLLLALPSVALVRLTSQYRHLVLGSFVMATILLTGSRTGLILAAVAITVLCVASRKFSYLAALVAIAWGAYELLEFLVRTDAVRDWFPYLSELLLKVDGALHGNEFDLASINSFHSRLENWEQTLDWYHIRPWLGCGPLREIIPSFADNYYVYLLSRYGLIGLSLYILYSVYVGGLAVLALLRKRRPCEDWALVTLTSLVVVNVANYTIDAFIIVPVGSVCLLYSGFMVSLMDMPDSAPLRPRVPHRKHVPPRRLPRQRASAIPPGLPDGRSQHPI